jgi:outer membrane receptor protein involved in Fe transport
MASDPPLNQVVTKTWEGGLRGRYGRDFAWSAGLFNATNHDDIQFLSAGRAAGYGYFDNVGTTRRRGLEASFVGKESKLSYGANYTYINAEYRTPMTVMANNNSSSRLTDVDVYSGTYYPANSQIDVKKGDKIPLIPENIFKGFLSYELAEKFNVGGDMIFVSGSYARGNENNQHQAGTVNWNNTSPNCVSIPTNISGNLTTGNACSSGTESTFRGPGKIAGYATFNMFASYDIAPEWKVFGRVNNVFDREYATAGVLGADPFNSNGSLANANLRSTVVGDTLVAPGAPRSAWVGVRWEFGGAKKSAE